MGLSIGIGGRATNQFSPTTLRSFEAGKRYVEGQAIVEDGALYIAAASFQAGEAFDPGDWTRIGTAPGELESKQNKLVAGDNMEISDEDDPLSPVIRAKTIQPDTAAEEGQIADARKTAAMIAEAARSTHNRGKVISAYTPVTVYSLHPGFAITTGSSGYQLGDSLQYGLKYIDILLVVTAVDTEGAVTDVSVSSLGASDVDFAPEGGATILPMHGGHGTGFSIQAESGADLGTILSDIVSPQPNDEVRVVLDETHSGQSWDWVYADYNGDGIHNWVSLAPAGGTRDFYLNPLETGEIEDSAVTDAKLGSRTLTDSDASETLPETSTLSTILQTIRNCLKWLAAQFDIDAGHNHDGVNSRALARYLVEPDYMNKETTNRITANNGTWTVPEGYTGFIRWYVVAYKDIVTKLLTINGKIVQQLSDYETSGVNDIVPIMIFPGDVIQISARNVSGNLGTSNIFASRQKEFWD